MHYNYISAIVPVQTHIPEKEYLMIAIQALKHEVRPDFYLKDGESSGS